MLKICANCDEYNRDLGVNRCPYFPNVHWLGLNQSRDCEHFVVKPIEALIDDKEVK